jgi:hypothetical protein
MDTIGNPDSSAGRGRHPKSGGEGWLSMVGAAQIAPALHAYAIRAVPSIESDQKESCGSEGYLDTFKTHTSERNIVVGNSTCAWGAAITDSTCLRRYRTALT